MKTRKHFFGMAIAIIALAIAIIGCKHDESAEVKPPDTPRALSFGTPACTVTITSNDKFTADEWNTLCDKVVAAIGRGYGASTGAAKTNIANYFTNNTVSVALIKSATYDCEVKSEAPRTMYFKANGSAIDGIPDANLVTILAALRGSGSTSYPTP